MPSPPKITAALAQIAPVFLDRESTLEKVISWTSRAADEGASLVAFGETLVPGYPLWICRTDGARFDAADQKELHARYCAEAVQIERGDLDPLAAVARERGLAVVLGIVERPLDRGGHSVYCSRVYIDPRGEIASVHRKLMPTYEERLSWATGDGAGLTVHELGPFRVGALNCWENWMPLARAALYAQGEDVHVALWPGNEINTADITRFIARESRSYVLSVCGLLRGRDVPADLPSRDRFVADDEELLLNGGSAVAGPDGEWILPPVVGGEELRIVELDANFVARERQNFDPSGHYARPDVLELRVDRRRQSSARFLDEPGD